MTAPSVLTRPLLLRLLRKLSRELEKQAVRGEILVLGGCAFVLAFKSRPATRDLDAIFEPKTTILSIADRVAKEEGLPEGWLNDGVKGFLSGAGETEPFLDLPGLRVFVPSAEYLFAMKALSMRLSEESRDIEDLKFLIPRLGIRTLKEAMHLMEKYYPEERIPTKGLSANKVWPRRRLAGMDGEEASEGRCGAIG